MHPLLVEQVEEVEHRSHEERQHEHAHRDNGEPVELCAHGKLAPNLDLHAGHVLLVEREDALVEVQAQVLRHVGVVVVERVEHLRGLAGPKPRRKVLGDRQDAVHAPLLVELLRFACIRLDRLEVGLARQRGGLGEHRLLKRRTERASVVVHDREFERDEIAEREREDHQDDGRCDDARRERLRVGLRERKQFPQFPDEEVHDAALSLRVHRA